MDDIFLILAEMGLKNTEKNKEQIRIEEKLGRILEILSEERA